MEKWVIDRVLRTKMLELLDRAFGNLEVDALLSDFTRLGTEYGGQTCFRLLENLTSDEDQRTRIMGSVALILFDRDSNMAYAAIENLHEGLKSELESRRNFCVFWLQYTETAKPHAIPLLAKSFKTRNSEEPIDLMEVWAAAVVIDAYQGDEEFAEIAIHANGLMMRCLREGDIAALGIAANTFRKHGTRSQKRRVQRLLLGRYDSGVVEDMIVILSCIGKLGLDSPEVRMLFETAMRSSESRIDQRAMAICMSRHLPLRSSWVDTLALEALQSGIREIVLQAVACMFTRRKKLPEKAWGVLVEQLNGDDVDLRRLVASVIGDIGKRITIATDALYERLFVEDDNTTAVAIIEAMAMIGKPIAARLVRKLEESGIRDGALIQTALIKIGENCVSDVIDLLLNSSNPICRSAAASVLHTLGPRAIDAIPVLEKLLVHEDPERIMDALNALSYMGPDSHSAACSVVRLLDHIDPTIRQWAELVLRNMGPTCIDALINYLPMSSAHGKESCERILKRLEVSLERLSRRSVEAFGVSDRDDLELFYWIGRCFTDEGSVSFRKLASRLEQWQVEGKMRDSLPVSESSLRKFIGRIEKQLTENVGSKTSIRLIETGDRKKGGLSEFGRTFLSRVSNQIGKDFPQR